MTKEQFLEGVANWDNHRYLLWPALEATDGLVCEFGIGDGSTPFLSGYCQSRHRELISYENNEEWLNKFNQSHPHIFIKVDSWESLPYFQCDVLLIDHAPGERRWEDIKKYANRAKYIVIHDSEPAATGYMLDKIWHLFKYRKDYKTEGAWATVVSNFFDVTKFVI